MTALQAVQWGRATLVRFSAGGWSTLLAASGNSNVSCWVGLDPVGMGRMATRAAESLRCCFSARTTSQCDFAGQSLPVW